MIDIRDIVRARVGHQGELRNDDVQHRAVRLVFEGVLRVEAKIPSVPECDDKPIGVVSDPIKRKQGIPGDDERVGGGHVRKPRDGRDVAEGNYGSLAIPSYDNDGERGGRCGKPPDSSIMLESYS